MTLQLLNRHTRYPHSRAFSPQRLSLVSTATDTGVRRPGNSAKHSALVDLSIGGTITVGINNYGYTLISNCVLSF